MSLRSNTKLYQDHFIDSYRKQNSLVFYRVITANITKLQVIIYITNIHVCYVILIDCICIIHTYNVYNSHILYLYDIHYPFLYRIF